MDNWTFNYYAFLNRFCREPVDIEDFIDGCVAIGILVSIDVKLRGIG